MISERERLMSKVHVAVDGCWLWTGATNPDGYGRIQARRNGKWVVSCAHRVSYELHKGEVPQGLQLDHLCRVPRCVNPDHLEPVTQRENMRRGTGRWARTHRTGMCMKGLHPLPPGGPCKLCVKARVAAKRLARALQIRAEADKVIDEIALKGVRK